MRDDCVPEPVEKLELEWRVPALTYEGRVDGGGEPRCVVVLHDLERPLRLADRRPAVVGHSAPDGVGVGDVVEYVGRAQRPLTPVPVERQPVREGGSECVAEVIEARQLLDQGVEELVLGRELRDGLAVADGKLRREEGRQPRRAEADERDSAHGQPPDGPGQARHDRAVALDPCLSPGAR